MVHNNEENRMKGETLQSVFLFLLFCVQSTCSIVEDNDYGNLITNKKII